MTATRSEMGTRGSVASGSDRFFFSMRVRGRLLPDREGVHLSAGTDIEACARYLAARLRSECALPETELAGCEVEVTNGQGEPLLTVPVPSI